MIWLKFLDAIEGEHRAVNMASIACIEEGTSVLRLILEGGNSTFHAVTNLTSLLQKVGAAVQEQRGSPVIIVEID